MKRLFILPLFALLSPLLFVGCGERGNAERIASTHYTITATLLPESRTLLTETVIECVSPAEGLSALKFRLYANAYREGNEVVTPEKKSVAYGIGKISYGGTEILSIQSDLPIQNHDLGQEGTLLTVRFGQKFKRGERIRLKITEKITLATVKHRLGYYDGYFNVAHFYPELCPFREGKFLTYPITSCGDPFLHETADFSLDVTLPVEYECACSSHELFREAQGTVAHYSYRMESVRDVAFVASEKLRCQEAEAGGVPIRYYYRSDAEYAKTLACITDAVTLFSEAFGAYPYPTYTVVATPFCEAGSEHAGMGLISCDLSPADRREAVVHETAHQWWFGKVGNDEYRDPWMDEGLAEYATAYFAKMKEGERAYRAKIQKAEDDYAILLALKGAEGARFDLTLEELKEGYYDRVYCGGSLLFCTLAERFGFPVFNEALRRYANAFAGKVAAPQDLISSLSASLGEDLSRVFTEWLTARVPVQ